LSKLLEEAIRLTELGYPVFPCKPGAKSPATQHGHKDVTTSKEIVEKWWGGDSGANLAIPTEGLLVVDVDGADNPWPNDPDKSRDLAAGAVSRTPRGGRHFIFRQPDGKDWGNTAGKIAPMVDTRGDGGYILVAPSEVDGKFYEWLIELDVSPDGLPEPPTWLALMTDGAGEPIRSAVAPLQLGTNSIPAGQRNHSLASIGGTLRRIGLGEPEILAAISATNSARCTPPLEAGEVEQIAASVARYDPDQVAVAITEDHFAQMMDDTEPSNEIEDPGKLPKRLLQVPGFVSEVMDYTQETAPYPEPVLAFCGALGLQGVLSGRKVCDVGDNRTNVFIMALANSGVGKNFPRQVNQKIMIECGLADSLGDTFASGEGIEDRLSRFPSTFFQVDEVDGLMSAISSNGRETKNENIMNVLLKMYSSSNSIYLKRTKAGHMVQDVIDQPCLCVFGTAIPKNYYESLSEKMLTNGFLSRMIILEAGRRSRSQQPKRFDVPKRVVATANWWAKFKPGGTNGQQWHPVPVSVPSSAPADVELREAREVADDLYRQAEDKGDGTGMTIWARANEKVCKLALLYACSENHKRPMVSKPGVKWARELVDYQIRRTLYMAWEFVYSSEFHAKCKRMESILREWRAKNGEEWMPFWQISRRLPWTEREHDDVRGALLGQRVIQYSEKATGGAPQRLYRLVP